MHRSLAAAIVLWLACVPSYRTGSDIADGGNDAEPDAPPLPDGALPRRGGNLSLGGAYYGVSYSCALKGGNVYCWGSPNEGQLGRGSLDAGGFVPEKVVQQDGAPLDEIVRVESGEEHACALRRTGEVFCWGSNDTGQLGTSPPGRFPFALRARTSSALLEGASDLSVRGNQGCAVVDGGLFCFGDNAFSQLTTTFPSPSEGYVWPLRDEKLAGAKLIVFGHRHACAIAADGKLLCWGNNDFRQAGQIASQQCIYGPCVKSPTEVNGVGPVKQLSLSPWHTCALDTGGTVRCWGRNGQGQLGVPKNSTTSSCYERGSDAGEVDPCSEAPAVALQGADQIAIGGRTSCALKGGVVYCWGSDGFGQRGQGNNTPGVDFPAPIAVKDDTDFPLGDVVEIAAHDSHDCALKKDGSIWCWGAEPGGALGIDAGIAHRARRSLF